LPPKLAFCMSSLDVTCVTGQDLANTKSKRTTLFAAKGMAMFTATVASAVITLIVSATNASNLPKQLEVQGSIVVRTLSISFVALLLFVKEDIAAQSNGMTKASSTTKALNFVLGNRPFMEYVAVKVLTAVANHIYTVMSLYYFKYVLHSENSVQSNGIMSIIGVSLTGPYLLILRFILRKVSARILWCRVAFTFTFSIYQPHTCRQQQWQITFGFYQYTLQFSRHASWSCRTTFSRQPSIITNSRQVAMILQSSSCSTSM